MSSTKPLPPREQLRQPQQHAAPSSPTRPAAAIEADGLAGFVTLARGAQCGPDAERCCEKARTAPPTPSAPPAPSAHKRVRTPPPRLFASLSRSALTSPSRWTKEPREHSAGEKQNLAIMMSGDSADGDSPTTPLGSELGAGRCGRYDLHRIVSGATGAPGGYDAGWGGARRGVGSAPPGTPIPPSHMPREEVADGSAARKVCSVVGREKILAEIQSLIHVDARLREVRRPRRRKLQSSMD